MKCVLASDDKRFKEGFVKVAELVGKPANEINAVFILDAYVGDPGDHRWFIKCLMEILNNFGGKFEVISLLGLDWKINKQRIEDADVICCEMGNTQYLMRVFEKSGFDKHVLEVLKNKVWLGFSAGAQILARMPSVNLLKQVYSAEEEFYGIENYLNIFNFVIMPHAIDRDPTGHDGKNFKLCVAESKKLDCPLYVLSNYSAVVVDGDKTYMIGKGGRKLVKGKVVEEV